MDSVVALVDSLANQDQPVLTWYGHGGDRVDLSGRTTANWVTKATNLLTMDLSAEPGTRIWLDLPTHWRTIIWSTAAWCAGAQVSLTPDADVVVTADAGSAHGGMDTIVIALPALARQVEALPDGAIDGAADLMTQADSFVLPPGDHRDRDTGLSVSQRDLLFAEVPLTSMEDSPKGSPVRVLIIGDDVAALIRHAPAIWASGGSIVLTHDPELAQYEGATHLLHLGG